MRRLTLLSTLGVLGAMAALGATASAASAAAYPPPSGGGSVVTIPNPGSGTCQATGFGPGTPYSVAYSGGGTTVSPYLTGTTPGTGNIPLTVQASDPSNPHLSLNGGPTVPAGSTGNTFTLTGTTSTGSARSFSCTVNIQQPQAISSVSPTSPSAITSTSSSKSLAFTGADIALMVLGGLALVGAGGALVIGTRRRHHTAD